VLLIERRTLSIGWSELILGGFVMLAIAAPWYVAMWWQHGPSHLEGFFIGDNFERFATSRFNDPRPWWFYAPVIAGGLLPWTPLALVWLRPLRQFVTRRRDVNTLDLRLLLWAFLPLAFYTASVGKQPRYILPMLPPVAMLLAASILDRTREWRSFDGTRMTPRRERSIVIGGVASGFLLVGLAALLYRARPLLVHIGDGYTTASAVVIGLAGLAVVITSLSRAWRSVPAVLAIAAAIGLPALHFGALSAAGDDTVQQVARAVLAERRANEPIASYQVLVRNLVFYTGLQQGDLASESQLRDYLSGHARVLAIVRADALETLERAHGLSVKRLAEFEYFNEGGIRLRTLIWPDESEDLQRIVLISNY
jgi:4-amino-4-deoxy-L-arabinose transferase-like glycosyltransferase